MEGRWYFRVYESVDKSRFVDYELRHWDLAVEIDDSSASFYVDENQNAWVDYSPTVLGLTEVSQ